MQRRRGKSAYVRSGVPGKRPRAPLSRPKKLLRGVVLMAVALGILILLIYGAVSLFTRGAKPVRLNALPTDKIAALGENVLYYDGAALRCVGPNGAARWAYQLGANADFRCAGGRIVAWAGNQLYVFDANGVCTFNDRMDAPVRFAAIGESFVAACLGDGASATVRVMNHNGVLTESIQVNDLYAMDVGFFSSRGRLMWLLSLDIQGNAPISNLSTYEPGRMSTGAVELSDELVYQIYEHNNLLMLVDTDTITAYDYKCVEQTNIAPILVYGWQMAGLRTAGNKTYALLAPQQDVGAGALFSELRLVTNYATQALRLHSPCFASGLNERGVYGFGNNVVYFIPYGESAVRATYLTYTLTDFICMLGGGRAVMASGNDVFIMKLPQ